MFFPCNCFPILFSLSNLFLFGTFPFLRSPDKGSRRFRKAEHFSGILAADDPFPPERPSDTHQQVLLL